MTYVDDMEYEVQCPECGWVGYLDECLFQDDKYYCPDCAPDFYNEVEDWEDTDEMPYV